MSENKMIRAYRYLLDLATKQTLAAEEKSWELLKNFIAKAEHLDSEVSSLTSKEFNQVQKDVQADIDQLAEYLNDVEKGVEEFINMDLPVLEQILIDKALSLCDPTELMILRLRIAAAMDGKQAIFDAAKDNLTSNFPLMLQGETFAR